MSKLEGTVLLTADQLRELLAEVVRAELGAQKAAEGYLDTEQAAAYLGTTVRSLQSAVHRGKLVPDHRGHRGGLRGNRFTKATLDAFCRRKPAQ